MKSLPKQNEVPIVFLFDADSRKAGSAYGARFDPAFLRALKSSDKTMILRSLIMRGDLLISNPTYRPTKLSTSSKTKYKSSSIKMSGNRDAFATFIGDLCDAFDGQWNTLNLIHLPGLIGRTSIHCISIPTMRTKMLLSMDQTLRNDPCYLGAVLFDLANPLQYQLFIESLFHDAFIEKGSLFMSLDYDDEFQGVFHGAEEFSAHGIRELGYAEFNKRCPSIPKLQKLNARGLITQKRVKNKTELSLHERLITLLSKKIDKLNLTDDFEWDLNDLPDHVDEVVVQVEKLTEYLLNDKNPKNKGKAKFLENDLSIKAEDWKYLHAQLIDSLASAPIQDLTIDNWGIRFNSDLIIEGRNGVLASLKTGWIIRKGERATFVTAFPAAEKPDPNIKIKKTNVLPTSIKGNERWEQLFELALAEGVKAGEACVPKPLKVQGYRVEMGGDCGGASIRLFDARTGFAKWMKDNGHASSHYRTGVYVSARTNSQSVERAIAYANAFAKVLRQNGIKSEVESYFT